MASSPNDSASQKPPLPDTTSGKITRSASKLIKRAGKDRIARSLSQSTTTSRDTTASRGTVTSKEKKTAFNARAKEFLGLDDLTKVNSLEVVTELRALFSNNDKSAINSDATIDACDTKDKKNTGTLGFVKEKFKMRFSKDMVFKERRARRMSVGTSEEEIERRAELKRIRERRIRDEISNEMGYDEDAKSMRAPNDTMINCEEKGRKEPIVKEAESVTMPEGESLSSALSADDTIPKAQPKRDEDSVESSCTTVDITTLPNSSPGSFELDMQALEPLVYEPTRKRSIGRRVTSTPVLRLPPANAVTRRRLASIQEPGVNTSWRSSFTSGRRGEALRRLSEEHKPLLSLSTRESVKQPGHVMLPTSNKQLFDMKKPLGTERTADISKDSMLEQVVDDRMNNVNDEANVELAEDIVQLIQPPAEMVAWLYSQGLRSPTQPLKSLEDNLHQVSPSTRRSFDDEDLGGVDGTTSLTSLTRPIHLHELNISRALAPSTVGSSTASTQPSVEDPSRRRQFPETYPDGNWSINSRRRYMGNTSESLPLSESVPSTWGNVRKNISASRTPSAPHSIGSSRRSSPFDLAKWLAKGRSKKDEPYVDPLQAYLAKLQSCSTEDLDTTQQKQATSRTASSASLWTDVSVRTFGWEPSDASINIESRDGARDSTLDTDNPPRRLEGRSSTTKFSRFVEEFGDDVLASRGPKASRFSRLPKFMAKKVDESSDGVTSTPSHRTGLGYYFRETAPPVRVSSSNYSRDTQGRPYTGQHQPSTARPRMSSLQKTMNLGVDGTSECELKYRPEEMPSPPRSNVSSLRKMMNSSVNGASKYFLDQYNPWVGTAIRYEDMIAGIAPTMIGLEKSEIKCQKGQQTVRLNMTGIISQIEIRPGDDLCNERPMSDERLHPHETASTLPSLSQRPVRRLAHKLSQFLPTRTRSTHATAHSSTTSSSSQSYDEIVIEKTVANDIKTAPTVNVPEGRLSRKLSQLLTNRSKHVSAAPNFGGDGVCDETVTEESMESDDAPVIMPLTKRPKRRLSQQISKMVLGRLPHDEKGHRHGVDGACDQAPKECMLKSNVASASAAKDATRRLPRKLSLFFGGLDSRKRNSESSNRIDAVDKTSIPQDTMCKKSMSPCNLSPRKRISRRFSQIMSSYSSDKAKLAHFGGDGALDVAKPGDKLESDDSPMHRVVSYAPSGAPSRAASTNSNALRHESHNPAQSLYQPVRSPTIVDDANVVWERSLSHRNFHRTRGISHESEGWKNNQRRRSQRGSTTDGGVSGVDAHMRNAPHVSPSLAINPTIRGEEAISMWTRAVESAADPKTKARRLLRMGIHAVDDWEAQLESNSRVAKRASQMIDGVIAPARRRRETDPFPPTWCQYPSHTRPERSIVAGPANHIMAQDFAIKHKDENTGDIEYHHSSPHPHFRIDESIDESDGVGGALQLPVRLGRYVRKGFWHLLTRAQLLHHEDAIGTLGRKSSLSTEGMSAFPELELLSLGMQIPDEEEVTLEMRRVEEVVDVDEEARKIEEARKKREKVKLKYEARVEDQVAQRSVLVDVLDEMEARRRRYEFHDSDDEIDEMKEVRIKEELCDVLKDRKYPPARSGWKKDKLGRTIGV